MIPNKRHIWGASLVSLLSQQHVWVYVLVHAVVAIIVQSLQTSNNSEQNYSVNIELFCKLNWVYSLKFLYLIHSPLLSVFPPLSQTTWWVMRKLIEGTDQLEYFQTMYGNAISNPSRLTLVCVRKYACRRVFWEGLGAFTKVWLLIMCGTWQSGLC